MKIAIVYDSRTGTTAAAARAMAASFTASGHTCEVRSVTGAVPEVVSRADLICVGSWTRGLLWFRQRATEETMGFLQRLQDLKGKKAVVFCTYKVATGQMLPRMAQVLRDHGAEVVGTFQFKGSRPTSDFSAFAGALES